MKNQNIASEPAIKYLGMVIYATWSHQDVQFEHTAGKDDA